MCERFDCAYAKRLRLVVLTAKRLKRKPATVPVPVSQASRGTELGTRPAAVATLFVNPSNTLNKALSIIALTLTPRFPSARIHQYRALEPKQKDHPFAIQQFNQSTKAGIREGREPELQPHCGARNSDTAYRTSRFRKDYLLAERDRIQWHIMPAAISASAVRIDYGIGDLINAASGPEFAGF